MSKAVETCFANLPDGPVGVAVSGGSDSLALLLLAQDTGRSIVAATVDHGLRPDSRTEAEGVAAICAEHGILHQILHWEDPPKGNLQAAAREARLSLLGDWAKAQGAVAVALGHTRDDQAETVLMRLARGSGVDGLAGMAQRRVSDGTLFVRPLITVQRSDLQVFLENRNLSWVSDPSNEDARFNRVKARQALRDLAPLGITTQGLISTAARMARARSGLEQASFWLAKNAAHVDGVGSVRLDVEALREAGDELALRVLAHSLCWISGQAYRPRASALDQLLSALGQSKRLTLHGVDCLCDEVQVHMVREPERAQAAVPMGAVWDQRWLVQGAGEGEVAALGEEGLLSCPDWRETGFDRRSLMATPAVWKSGRIVAAPCAGLENGYKAELIGGPDGYFAAILAG